MNKYFPKYGWAACNACIILMYYVGIILFWQVLSQSLYPILIFAIGSEQSIQMTADWSQFSLSYTCLIIFMIVIVMTAPRDTMYIKRVNAFGVVFVSIFVLFVTINGFMQMRTTKYVYSEQAYQEAISDPTISYTAYIPLIGPKFMPLIGILGGGFYLHNMSLSFVQNAEKPEHNTRNIFIGFVLVFLTYTLIGVTGVYGFTGSAFEKYNPSVNLIKENCLNMMSSDSYVATFIRACIICQLLSVYTLLFGLLRS